MPLPRRPHRASPDEIKITRNGDTAIIAYADDKVSTTHLTLGAGALAGMTDEQLLEFWNEHIEARDEFMREQEHVAVEIPVGKPQIRYFELADQWVPRGHVLRCVILGSNGEANEPFISIDDRDFTPAEFVRMVGSFGGWGMRIVFVPDDEVHEEPVVEVREPDSSP